MQRREMLLATLMAALATEVQASPLDAAQTIIAPPDARNWVPNKGYPERSVDMCPLSGSTTEPGLYLTLVR